MRARNTRYGRTAPARQVFWKPRVTLPRELTHALDDLLTRAFAEDGEDITSLSVFGPAARVAAKMVCREDAVVAGAAFLPRLFAFLSPPAARGGPRPGRRPREDGRGPRRGRGAGDHRARGRAHGPEPRPAPLRHRDDDARVRRRAEGHARGPSRHAEDDARPAPFRAVRRALRRRHESPPRPLRRLPRQGQPRGRRRLVVGSDAPRRRLPRAEPPPPRPPPRGRGAHARRGASGARRGRRARAPRQHDDGR